jgi:hypothetical protein
MPFGVGFKRRRLAGSPDNESSGCDYGNYYYRYPSDPSVHFVHLDLKFSLFLPFFM